MKFKGLDGRTHGISIDRFKWNGRGRSKGEETLGNLLHELFPLSGIFHEFTCPSTRLRLDFFLPSLFLAFEFDGNQHEKFTPHFHKDRIGYAQSQTNDASKEQWCELNNITLVRVVENELDLETLESKIDEAA